MEAFLRLGLTNALAATVLALLAATASLALRRRRPAVVHALWLLVLLRLLTPPLWNVLIPVSLPSSPKEAVVRPEAAAKVTSSFAEAQPGDLEGYELVFQPVGAVPLHLTNDRPRFTRESVIRAVVVAWLAGSIACVGLVMIRCGRFARLLRHATPAPPALTDAVAAIASRLGVRRPPEVLIVPGAICPMLWAVLGRPRLLLPDRLFAELGDAERDALLAHELAHLRRRDHWVRLVEVAATVLYWWHPAAWWARRELREAEEQCCDAWVVWSIPRCARQYMNAILKAVDYVSDAATARPEWRLPAVPPVASGMASGQFRQLERRLSMIRQNDSTGRGGVARGLGRAGLVAVCAGALGLLPLAPSLAQQSVSVVAAPNADGHDGEAKLFVTTTDVAAEPAPKGVVELTAPERHVVVQLAPGEVPQAEPKGVLTLTRPEVDSAPVTVEFSPAGSEVERARQDVERLTAELEAAKARLKGLEAGAGAAGDPKPKTKIKARLAPVSVKKGNGAPEAFYVAKDRPQTTTVSPQGQDQQRRLDDLEQKLDRLIDEMHDMKRQQRGNNAGPATSWLGVN